MDLKILLGFILVKEDSNNPSSRIHCGHLFICSLSVVYYSRDWIDCTIIFYTNCYTICELLNSYNFNIYLAIANFYV